MKDSAPTLVVAGGGTGGHVLAGVAVADAWKEKWGPQAKVVFVGAEGGIEEKLVPRAGYPLELLKLGSLNRVSLQRRIRTMIQLPLSFLKSLAILISNRPKAVLGVGGYASGPFVLLARCFSRTAILEQNAVPGITNRILGRFAHRIFCAFPGSDSQFPKQKVRITGNPIRSAIRPTPSASRTPFKIFAFGGSQGALGLNTLLLDSLEHLQDLKARIRILHQTGETDFERVRAGYAKPERQGFDVRVEKFIHDMPTAYKESSLLICRAGSSTLAEVAAVGRAAVLIPFPYASDNHQEKNARIFVDAGAAFLLVQKESQGRDLAAIIRRSIENTAIIDEMEKKISQFYRPTAAQDIARFLYDE